MNGESDGGGYAMAVVKHTEADVDLLARLLRAEAEAEAAGNADGGKRRD